MQRYVPEIRNGEKRVLVAGSKIICAYQKDIVLSSDHRTNVRQGGASTICDLSTQEMALCSRIGSCFGDLGLYYIGIDLAYPYVIELNVINPGGLINYARLTGENRAPHVVETVLTMILSATSQNDA
jgi:glutathione synthase